MRIAFVAACLSAVSTSMAVDEAAYLAMTDFAAEKPSLYSQANASFKKKAAGMVKNASKQPGFWEKAKAKFLDMKKDMPAFTMDDGIALATGAISTAAAIPQAMAGNPLAMYTVGSNAFKLGKAVYNKAKQYKANRKKRTGKDNWMIQRIHGS